MTSATKTMFCKVDQHYWQGIRCQCGAYEWNQVEVERLTTENAALRQRVQELELQVALLMPSYTEVTITGSDHTNYDGEGVA